MADDFYSHAAFQRLAQIEAMRAQALADLATSKANSDYESAAASVQTIANLEAEKANVANLHRSYVASQTPPTPPELSAEEKAAKPLHRMNWQDGLDLAKTSKYGKTLSWDDPHVRAGLAEAQARRRRGE
jgi:hypothetical protein